MKDFAIKEMKGLQLLKILVFALKIYGRKNRRKTINNINYINIF